MRKLAIWKKILLGFLLLILVGEGMLLYSFDSSFRAAKQDKVSEEKDNPFKGQKAEDKNDINVLLIGSDSRGEDRGRSDTLMIAHYDQKHKTPKIVSIMRDAYVDIPGYGNEKINAAYSYGGVELVRQTIAENFDIPIEYYVVVNFEDFKDIVDTLFPKGVEIDAEKDLELDGVNISKGNQMMDGNTLLQYARFRKDDESDFGRVRRQQQVMTAMAEQSTNLVSLAKLPATAGKILGYVSTNIPNNIVLSCATDFLLGETKPVENMAVPLEGTWDFAEYEDAGSVIELDLAKNSEAMKHFLTE